MFKQIICSTLQESKCSVKSCHAILQRHISYLLNALWRGFLHAAFIGKALSMLLLFPISIYRRFISPCLPAHCRFYPSCSQYATEALRCPSIPFHKALWLIIRRLSKCHPGHPGGVDKLPIEVSQQIRIDDVQVEQTVHASQYLETRTNTGRKTIKKEKRKKNNGY